MASTNQNNGSNGVGVKQNASCHLRGCDVEFTDGGVPYYFAAGERVKIEDSTRYWIVSSSGDTFGNGTSYARDRVCWNRNGNQAFIIILEGSDCTNATVDTNMIKIISNNIENEADFELVTGNMSKFPPALLELLV